MKLKLKKKAQWPPKIFDCKLETMLKEKFKEEYTLVSFAAYLGVTPITAKNILRGGTISLENAIRCAVLVGRNVMDIWSIAK